MCKDEVRLKIYLGSALSTLATPRRRPSHRQLRRIPRPPSVLQPSKPLTNTPPMMPHSRCRRCPVRFAPSRHAPSTLFCGSAQAWQCRSFSSATSSPPLLPRSLVSLRASQVLSGLRRPPLPFPINLNPKQVSNTLSFHLMAPPVVLRARPVRPYLFRVYVASTNVASFISLLGKLRLGTMELQIHVDEAAAVVAADRLTENEFNAQSPPVRPLHGDAAMGLPVNANARFKPSTRRPYLLKLSTPDSPSATPPRFCHVERRYWEHAACNLPRQWPR